MKYKEISTYIQPDGTLYCLGHYIHWTPGDQKITLDCEFTLEELKEIIHYMETNSKK